jgi:hypothetical protein
MSRESSERGHDDLTPEQHLSRAWTGRLAEEVCRRISEWTTQEMLADGEDPTDTPLYLLRRRQVLIGLECCLDEAERNRTR